MTLGYFNKKIPILISLAFFVFSNTVFATGNLKFNLGDDGMIGIGTTVPTAQLHVSLGIFAGASVTSPIFGNVGGNSMMMVGNNFYISNLLNGTGIGTVNTSGNINLVGVGTQFLTTFKVGDIINVAGEPVKTIASILSDTELTVNSAFSSTATGKTYTKNQSGNNAVFLGNGNIGFGIDTPSALLHLASGTINNPSFKLSVGQKLTTTQAGAFEFDGTHLYFTLVNGGTRYQIDQQTNGNIVYANSFVASSSVVTPSVYANNTGNLTLGTLTYGNVVITPAAGYGVGIGTTTPTSPLHVYTTNNDAITTLAVDKHNASATGIIADFMLNGASKAQIDYRGYFRGTYLYNLTSTSNAAVGLTDTGVSISRNVADTNTALTVNQQNNGSTGKIVDFQYGSVSKAYIDYTGRIYAEGLANLATGANSLVQTLTTGTNIYRNVADANPALVVNQANTGSTGRIVDFRYGSVSQAFINTAGAFQTSAGVANSTTSNNSYVATTTTGTQISRNVADANTALIVNQVNLGSTGKIVDFQYGAVSKATFDTSGNLNLISGDVRFNGSNVYPRIVKNGNNLNINVDNGGSALTALALLTSGNVGINTQSPTAKLHIIAGGTAASSAPLKFTNNATGWLTTPEAGSLEFSYGHLYFTNAAGGRTQLDEQAGTGTIVNANSFIASTSVITPYVYGSQAASGDLTLSSTLHGTKDKIYLGSAQTSVYDELNGRLGIGTGTPVAPLDITKSGYRQVVINNPSNNQKLNFGSVADTVGSYIFNNSFYNSSYNYTPSNTYASGIAFNNTGGLDFATNTGLTSGVDYIPNIRMTIDNAGKVGIGMTPVEKLDVTGNIKSNGIVSGTTFSGSTSASVPLVINSNATGTIDLTLQSVAGDVVLTPATGYGVGIGTTTPSQKLEVSGGNIKVVNGVTSGSAAPLIVQNTNAYANPYTQYSQIWLDSSGAVMASIRNDGSFTMGGSQGMMKPTRLQFSSSGSAANPALINSENINSGLFFADTGTSVGFSSNGVESMRIKGSNVGIGQTSPTAKLHIAAGTSTAGTAPLKLTAGTLMTNPEAGAIEFDGTHFWATIGTARYQVDQQADGAIVNVNTLIASTSVISPLIYGSQIASGDLTIDSTLHATKGNVILAPTTGNVGIGKTNPTYKLEIGAITSGEPTSLKISGASTNGIQIKLGDSYSGSVGMRYSGADTFLSSNAYQTTSATDSWSKGAPTYSSNIAKLGLSTDNTGTAFQILTSPANTVSTTYSNFFTQALFTVKESGSIGIGTSGPSSKLDVVGGIKTDSSIIAPSLYASNSGNLTIGTLTYGNVVLTPAAGYGVGVGITTPTSPLHVYTTNNDAITTLVVDKHNASATGKIAEFMLNGVSKTKINYDGSIGTVEVANNTDINNSYISLWSTGTKITRNIADANPALVVNQANATSTGKILDLQFNGGSQLSVATTGMISATAGIAHATSTLGRVAFNITGGVDLIHNTADAVPAVNINNQSATATGNILQLQAASLTKMIVSYAGNVGIGQTSPSAVLHLKDGGSAASTAPLKFGYGIGVKLATPETGTIEFDGNHFWVTTGYGTAASPVTRTQLDQQANGAIVNVNSLIASTSVISPLIYGSQVASADLTIDSTLHATKGDVIIAPNGGNVGIGTATPSSSLDIMGGIAKENLYSLADAATDNMLVNGDFEMAASYGWSGTNTVVSGGYSGKYAMEVAGNVTILGDDYIPIDPTRDIIQLEGYLKKTVAGTTPGVLYFGYRAYDAAKNIITTSPCGTYCYFAASGYVIPVDSAWHKFTATRTGEGTVNPNFPVGTKYIRVMAMVNYTGSADSVTQLDHITLKRIPVAPIFIGNDSSGANQVDQQQASKLYTTSANNLVIEVASGGNIGIGVTAPAQQLEISKNFRMPSTNKAALYGVIYKGTTPFLHDFSYGNNGTVTTVGYNTFLGVGAGNLTMGTTATANYEASYNTGVGYNSLSAITTGHYNTAFGESALVSNTAGPQNTAIGMRALMYNTTGANNTALGRDAGRYIANGSTSNTVSGNSLYLGYDARALVDGDTNEIVIGASTIGSGSNTVTLGNTNIVTTLLRGDVGIGIVPDAKLRLATGGSAAGDAPLKFGYGIGVKLATPETGTIEFDGNHFWVTTGYGTAASPVVRTQLDQQAGAGLIVSANTFIASTSMITPILYGSQAASGTLTLSSTLDATKGKILFGTSAYDEVNNRLGIGTASPAVALDVRASTPTLYVGATTGTNYALVKINNTGGDFYVGRNDSIGTGLITTGGLPYAGVLNAQGAYPLQFAVNNSAAMTILNGGNIGVGTTGPSSKFDVVGGIKTDSSVITPALYASNTGNLTVGTLTYGNVVLSPAAGYGVGIGVATPKAKLHVNGDVIIGTSSGGGTDAGVIRGDNFNNGSGGALKIGSSNTAAEQYIQLGQSLSGTGAFSPYMSIISGGNVGIGTTTPTVKLEVAGGIKVANNNWISSVDSAGTGVINMFKINTSNEIEVGGTLNIGTLNLAEDSGAVTVINMPVSASAVIGTEESYSFSLDSNVIGKIYAESDGAGGIQNPALKINGKLAVGVASPTAQLHIAVGGTTAGTAPLKLSNSGTSWLATPEEGAMEFAYGHLWFTYGSTRKQLDDQSVNSSIITVNTLTALTGVITPTIYGYGGNLSLTSDLGATKTKIYLGSTPTSAYDELNGRLGIGITTPTQKLQVKGTTEGLPSTSGTTQTNGIFRLGSTQSNAILDVGENASGGVWLQSTDQTNLASNYPILLNPNGGNVGIGTATPNENLVVKGLSPTLRIEDNNTAVSAGGILGDVDFFTSDASAEGNGVTARIRSYYQDQYGRTKLGFFAGDSGTISEKMTIDYLGNVGIGITTPNQQLEITKNFRMTSTTKAALYGIIYKGTSPFLHDFSYGNNGTVTTAGQNTFLGIDAGNLTMGTTATNAGQSSYNTGIGYQSLISNTTGYSNTATGWKTLGLNDAGYYNSAFGRTALYSNTMGSLNTALGYDAGRFIADSSNPNATAVSSLYLGAQTKSLIDGNTNEIVIGYNTIGSGTNTVTLGNTNIVTTLLRGDVGIGIVPDAKLRLATGGSAAGDAPLKFGYGIGIKLATPETGTIEFDGNHFWVTTGYGTAASPVVRTQLDQQANGAIVNVNSLIASTSVISPLIYGSQVASGTLTLGSTLDATKGKILFGTSAYDEVNNYLGVGTTVPNARLSVLGNIIVGNGNTDLTGTTSRITVSDASFTNTRGLNFSVPDGTKNPRAYIQHVTASDGTTQYVQFNSGYTTGSAYANWNFMNGSVGIGNIAPSEKLEVTGNIKSSGVVSGTTFSGSTSASVPLVINSNASGTIDLTMQSVAGDIVLTPAAGYGVGIGTANPLYKLQVLGDIYSNTGNYYLDSTKSVFWGDSTNGIEGETGVGLKLKTGGSTTRILVATSGNVGIGTASPTAKLHITTGGTAASSAPLKFTNNTTGWLTTPEAGAVEFSYGHLWFTNAAGGRTQLDEQAGTGTIVNANSFIASTSVITPYLYGSQASGGDLTIDSTLHATKGDVIIAPNGGNVGIGTTSPASNAGGLDISSGGLSLVMGADTSANTRTNLTQKISRIGSYHYTNAEEPVTMMVTSNSLNVSTLNIGGGSSLLNAATDIVFHTAANTTTVTGTERMRIDSAGNIGIGTSSPANADGWGRVLDTYGALHSKIIATTATNSVETGIYSHSTGYFGALAGGIVGTRSNHPLSLISYGAMKMTILQGGNVGIGLTNPGTKLDVVGGGIRTDTSLVTPLVMNATATGTIDLTMQSVAGDIILTPATGYGIGIGTVTPAYKLDVAGNIRTTSYLLASTGVYSDVFSEGTGMRNGMWVSYANSTTDIKASNGTTPAQIRLDGTTGNVGIGTTTPLSELSINGGVHIGGDSDAGDNNLLIDGTLRIGELYYSDLKSISLPLGTETWVNLATIPNNGTVRFQIRTGASNSEEIAEVKVFGTYHIAQTGITVERQTYNAHLREVRVTGSDGGLKTVYIRVRTDTYAPSVTWRVIESKGVVTINNTETSPTGGLALVVNGNLAISTNAGMNIGGNVGIGMTTSPTAKLNIAAGTATAGTAPLKLTAGTNLSTTEAGAIEYDGTNLYFTATNGGLRKQLNDQAVNTSVVTVNTLTAITGIITPTIYGYGGSLSLTSDLGATKTKIYLGSTPTSAYDELNGRLGIGITSPNEKITIADTNKVIDSNGNAYIYTTDTAAQNYGGQISFGGSYTGTTPAKFASISGRKEGAAAGNAAGYLAFATSISAGGSTTEKMRIASNGDISMGDTTSYGYKLYVGGNIMTYGFMQANSFSATTSVSTPLLATASGALGITPASGSNLNITLATTGDLAVNTNDLVVDTSAHYIGIGNTAPLAKMHITGSAVSSGNKDNLIIDQGSISTGYYSSIGLYQSTTNVGARITSGNSGSYSGFLAFETSNNASASLTTVERMRIDNTGNISIGATTTYGYKLYVGGNIMTYGFMKANTFSADVSIDSPMYNYSSDARLKTNITPLTNSLDKILHVGGYSFNWKDKTNDRTHIGLIAQDVEKQFPELVSTNERTGYKTVEYGNMVAPLIEAIKEQQKMINESKTQDAEQKMMIEELRLQNIEQQKQIDLLIKSLEGKK